MDLCKPVTEDKWMKQLKPITENTKWTEHVKYIPMLKSVVALGPGSFIFILYLNLKHKFVLDLAGFQFEFTLLI